MKKFWKDTKRQLYFKKLNIILLLFSFWKWESSDRFKTKIDLEIVLNKWIWQKAKRKVNHQKLRFLSYNSEVALWKQKNYWVFKTRQLHFAYIRARQILSLQGQAANRCFRFCGPSDLCHNYSNLPLQWEAATDRKKTGTAVFQHNFVHKNRWQPGTAHRLQRAHPRFAQKYDDHLHKLVPQKLTV